MANRIQLRRGGAQEWANSNPTLAQGELGIELDTGRFKIGDGVTAWNTLRYERPVESITNTANTLVQRDADGNFSAGTVTATLIGNASTAARLASTRQIQLSGDVQATGVFDGSTNLNLNTTVSLVATLPHYDGTGSSSGTYRSVTVDAKGRVTNASNPTTLAGYGLNGTVEGESAQPYDLDLVAIAGLTTTGIIARASGGNMQTRTITGTAGRIAINNGNGVSGNPTIDLITTTISAGDYNTESLTSSTDGSQTVNATKFSVDAYGRFTSATTVPIATATEGSKYANYDAGTAYSRYAIIQNASKVYQAYEAISAGAGAPTHSSGDNGGWRYLAAEATEQKGLASFAQEDFDVDGNGHVTIAALAVDNTQLQNNRISFADGNTKEDFELDQELTATTGYRGFNYLNYVKVNDTSGNLLFGANNTGDSGAGEIDVNVRSYFSDPDITLDGATSQTLDKSGDGNLTFSLTQNAASARNLSITSTNAGSGTSTVTISAEDVVDIDASAATGKVHIEDLRIQDNYLASTGQLNLDPGDDRAATGLVRIFGNLQIDGTTTTVNSTELSVDDVTILLGGDTAPGSDDNLDRGIEFRYYDSQARLGFYGWDTNYTDLGGHEGGYRFLHAATNTAEVFTGTDSGIIAGNVKLTTNTNSTSNTTGDLVVAGGAGIGQDVNIGGLLDVDGTFRANSTSRFDDNMVLQGASKTLQLNNGSGTTKIEFQSTTGNASIGGVIDVTGNFNVNTNKFNVVAASGNTTVAGTLGVTGVTTLTDALDANSSLNVAGLVHLESTDVPNILSGAPHSIQNNDYGALRVDGGGYFANDVLFNGDIYLNGDFNQQDDATENFGTRNYLAVRYKIRAGTSAAYTPNYATHGTSNLRVYGGAGIATTLHVGGTGSGEGLFVGKKNNGDTVKFSVLGASGNTDIQGTLDVAGNSEFNGTVDVDANFAVRNNTTDKFTVASATGNTVIEGTLDVNGATEITNTLDVSNAVTFDQTLLVQGNSEFNGTVDVDANFAVRSGSTDKFTVASSSGNVATDGTLIVQGQTTINDSLIVDAANEVFSIRNGSAVEKFGVDADNGNTNIIGTLTVGDAVQINDTLGVSDVVTFTRNTQQTLTGSYAADGAFRLTGGAGIGKNLAVSGDARIYGATELTGALDLNNSADISGALVTHDNVTITADNKFFKIQTGSAVDKFTVDTDNGNTTISGTLGVTGDLTASSDLTVTGNLIVNGTTTTVNSTILTVDDPIITLGGDTAPASNDGKDRGVEFRYYDSSAKVGFFGLDRSSLEYVFLTDATNTSEVHSGTDGALRAGSLNLTGSGTVLDVDANANIDGTLTVDGQIVSQVTSGAALVIPTTTKINNLNADLLDSMTTASAATATTIVARDSSGDFAANEITADLIGNASTATTLETARDIILEGVVTGTVSFNGSQNVSITTSYSDADITALAAQTGTGYMVRTAANTYAHRTLQVTASSGITLTNADGVSGNTTINVASSSTNSANNLVIRDASGDFAAGVITATRFVGDGEFDLVASTTLTKNVVPDTTNTYNLGSAAARYANIYGVNSNFSGVITVSGGVTGNLSGNLTAATTQTNGVVPSTSNTYNLGSAAARYANIYGTNGNFSGAITASGGVTGNLDGNLTASTTTTLGVAPVTTNTYNLGSSAARYANIYGTNGNFSGAITASGGVTGNLDGNLVASIASTKGVAPVTTNTYNLGSAAARYANIYGTNGNLSGTLTVSAGINGNLSGNLTASTTTTKGVTPDTTNTYSLGSSAARYANIYSTNGNFSGAITASGGITGDVNGNLTASTTTTKGVTPDTTNTYSLGSSAARYANVYGTNADFTGTITGDVTGDLTGDVTGDVTGTVSDISNHDTDALSEGSTNVYFTDSRADARVAAATGANLDLSSKSTSDLSEGTNQYYTEARVQAKLDNAFAQLSAMLNNLATTTTLTLNLNGDPTPGAVVTTGVSNGGGGGFTAGTAVTTSGGTGSGLTVDTTVVGGVITAAAVNAGGSDYLITDTVTVTNPNAGKVLTLNLASLAGGSNYVTGTALATTGGSGSASLTVDITAVAGAITNVTINDGGTGYAADETITIVQATGADGTNPGTGGTIDISTVATNATLSLTDITTMEVGATVTGATSGTTGVITALGTNQITVDNVDGFFKSGEVVSANDVTTLTISSFS